MSQLHHAVLVRVPHPSVGRRRPQAQTVRGGQTYDQQVLSLVLVLLPVQNQFRSELQPIRQQAKSAPAANTISLEGRGREALAAVAATPAQDRSGVRHRA